MDVHTQIKNMAKFKKSSLGLGQLNSFSGSVEQVISISLEKIEFTSDQTRTYVEPEELERLTISISSKGLETPILVRYLETGNYELVCGQKRLLAHQKLGLKTINAIARNLTREEALESGLIENLQRSDLNPVNETEGIIKYLCLKTQNSQEEIVGLLYRARKKESGMDVHTLLGLYETVGKRSLNTFVAEYLPILKMQEELLGAIRKGEISFSSARVLHRLKSEELRLFLLELVKESEVFSYKVLRKFQQLETTGQEIVRVLAWLLSQGTITPQVFFLLAQVKEKALLSQLIEEIKQEKLSATSSAIKERLCGSQEAITRSPKKRARMLFDKIEQDQAFWQDQAKLKRFQSLLTELEKLYGE